MGGCTRRHPGATLTVWAVTAGAFPQLSPIKTLTYSSYARRPTTPNPARNPAFASAVGRVAIASLCNSVHSRRTPRHAHSRWGHQLAGRPSAPKSQQTFRSTAVGGGAHHL